jgi:hypothetical protein
MTRRLSLVLFLAMVAEYSTAAGWDLNIGINVGVPAPPPPLVIASPPTPVVVPGTAVYYVPTASFNLFVYGGQYYSFHNGAWFSAATGNGPWTVVASERVPGPVLAVPGRYYRIPPGQARKTDGPPSEPDGHGRGWCPPGLAKQGRC